MIVKPRQFRPDRSLNRPSPAANVSRRPSLPHLLRLVALLLLFPLLYSTAASASGDYLLGVQDKLRIRVYEWRPSRDEVFEWLALNNEYTVNAAGRISLPLVGEVTATGIRTSDLAKSISERLKARIGLVSNPDVSVEIVQFRPFYIVGQVEKPGEYPYRPGLTVLRAVSVAGGLQRARELTLTRSISTMGELQLHALETNSLLARRARLEAELKGLEEIEFPRTLTERAHMTSISILMQQERLIYKSRREALKTQLQAYEQLKIYLEQEVESLNSQIKAQDKQAALLKQEHGGVSSLVSRGLAVTSRQLELERAMAAMEGDRLRLETNLMKARQDISRTDISVLELKNKYATEATLDLRQTQSKLEEVRQKADTAEKLLQETQTSTARLMSQRGPNGAPVPIYTIIRHSGEEAITIAATEASVVDPGDTVKVEFPVEEQMAAEDSPEPSVAQWSVPGDDRRAEQGLRVQN